MTKNLRNAVDAIKENRIKEKDGKKFVEVKPINQHLFQNDDEKEEFLTKIQKHGFKDFEVMSIMDRINESSVHHYEIYLK